MLVQYSSGKGGFCSVLGIVGRRFVVNCGWDLELNTGAIYAEWVVKMLGVTTKNF
jgi:hypothetical protein